MTALSKFLKTRKRDMRSMISSYGGIGKIIYYVADGCSNVFISIMPVRYFLNILQPNDRRQRIAQFQKSRRGVYVRKRHWLLLKPTVPSALLRVDAGVSSEYILFTELVHTLCTASLLYYYLRSKISITARDFGCHQTSGWFPCVIARFHYPCFLLLCQVCHPYIRQSFCDTCLNV